MQRVRWAIVAAVLAVAAIPDVGAAQLGKLLKKKAEEAATKKAAEAATKAMAGKPDTQATAPTAATPVASTAPSPAGGAAPAAPAATAAAAPGAGVWLNFDFQPGVRPLFVDDFSKDNVGDFPRRLEFKRGNMEVAEWNGARYVRISSGQSQFAIVLTEPLPDRFTLEFDASGANANINTEIRFAEKPVSFVVFREFSGKGQGGIGGTGATSVALTAKPVGPTGNEIFRFRIMADGKYVKVYLNESRIANVPNADLGRSNTITFDVAGTPEDPQFIGNLSLMAGGRKLYDDLSEKGRVATQGIYFDTGSDRIRPESAPTLKEIAGMLKEHADLKLVIEGHTDNVGAAAANLTLSEKRAAAVRQALVEQFGIDGARLTAQGLGVTKPAAPNDTLEGRQSNRRVELVKA